MKVDVKKLKPALVKEAKKLLMKYAVKLLQITHDEQPVFEGIMKGETKIFEGDGDLEVKIAVRVPYAERLHEGLPAPKMPDFEAMRFWVEKKMGVTGSAMYPIAKSLQKKMVTTGPDPNPFATRAVKRFKQIIGGK